MNTGTGVLSIVLALGALQRARSAARERCAASARVRQGSRRGPFSTGI